MNLKTISTILIALSILFAGCTTFVSPVVPPVGMKGVGDFRSTLHIGSVVSVVGAPVDTTFNDNDGIGSKCGESTAFNILGLVSFGDCSVDAAAENGNLSKVDHIDMDYISVLGVFYSYKTIVWGD